VLLLVLFELACQGMLWKLQRGWEQYKKDPAHFCQASTDPVLGYELRPNYSYTSADGRILHINKYGLREDDDVVPPASTRKIALLGDSVVFSFAATQNESLARCLQQAVDPSGQQVRVINFGLLGYSLREMPVLLRSKDAIYHVNEVVYVFNPNDFSWRNTMTEGGDSGLYRMYHRPILASPLFVRKAIYRYEKAQAVTLKNEVMVSAPWYKWMYSQNRERGFDCLRALKGYCDQHQIKFTVVLLPAFCAFHDGTYDVAQMYDEIAAFVKSMNVPVLEPRDLFLQHKSQWSDGTDHLTVEGNRGFAAYLAGQLQSATTQRTSGS
jgi:hypothetical protein